jgi:hypothetical protein
MACRHQRGGGHNAVGVAFRNGTVYALGHSKIICVYDKPLHPDSLNCNPSGTSQGVQENELWGALKLRAPWSVVPPAG